jgi:hypothetical protein
MDFPTPVVQHRGMAYAYAREVHLDALKGKPHAEESVFRYSSVANCTRREAYTWQKIRPTEPVDIVGATRMQRGTILHADVDNRIDALLKWVVQSNELSGKWEAMVEWPSSITIEVAGKQIMLFSGSADWMFYQQLEEGARALAILGEWKTLSDYRWAKCSGISPYPSVKTKKPPQGPPDEAMLQLALNCAGALQQGFEVQFGMSANTPHVPIKNSQREKLGATPEEAVAADWLIDPRKLEELANDAIRFWTYQLHLFEAKIIPAPSHLALDQDFNVYEEKIIPPGNGGAWWGCDYCEYKSLCILDGPEELTTPELPL